MVGAMPVNLIPKFCNGTMDSHNGTDENEIQVHIGSRVKCSDDFGTVKYIGEVHGYKGVWYGVEWDNPTRGKHDGSLDDVQYFKTSKPGAGSFIRPNKISPLRTCSDAIRKYYGDKEVSLFFNFFIIFLKLLLWLKQTGHTAYLASNVLVWVLLVLF